LNGEAKETKEVKELSDQETEKAAATEFVEPAAKDYQDQVSALENKVESKDGIITGLEDKLAKLNQDFEGARAAYAYAVEDYKKLALSTNPMLPADSLSGTTIEEVKESLDRALGLVTRVRELLSKGAEAASVPAGAPARTGADTTAMSTKEKINFGLEQARKKKE
jgi:5'-deoxynucleotidase YfbR-like HD superfamily hydrolase